VKDEALSATHVVTTAESRSKVLTLAVIAPSSWHGLRHLFLSTDGPPYSCYGAVNRSSNGSSPALTSRRGTRMPNKAGSPANRAVISSRKQAEMIRAYRRRSARGPHEKEILELGGIRTYPRDLTAIGGAECRDLRASLSRHAGYSLPYALLPVPLEPWPSFRFRNTDAACFTEGERRRKNRPGQRVKSSQCQCHFSRTHVWHPQKKLGHRKMQTIRPRTHYHFGPHDLTAHFRSRMTRKLCWSPNRQ